VALLSRTPLGCALFKIYLNEAERINSATLDAINGLSISTLAQSQDSSLQARRATRTCFNKFKQIKYAKIN